MPDRESLASEARPQLWGGGPVCNQRDGALAQLSSEQETEATLLGKTAIYLPNWRFVPRPGHRPSTLTSPHEVGVSVTCCCVTSSTRSWWFRTTNMDGFVPSNRLCGSGAQETVARGSGSEPTLRVQGGPSGLREPTARGQPVMPVVGHGPLGLVCSLPAGPESQCLK